MYFDSAYIAKYYVNEADSHEVRKVIRRADFPCSSSWAVSEVVCVFHRHAMLGSLTAAQQERLTDQFMEHVESGLWHLAPLSQRIINTTVKLVRRLPPTLPLRAGNAVHVATALEMEEQAIWTNDRHLLAAASHFGLVGKQV